MGDIAAGDRDAVDGDPGRPDRDQVSGDRGDRLDQDVAIFRASAGAEKESLGLLALHRSGQGGTEIGAKGTEAMVFSQDSARTLANILRDVAKAEILPRFRGEMAQHVREKTARFDLVTDADEAAEAAITAALHREFPGCAVLGEEAAERDPILLDSLSDADLAFVVDPVDGTKNFSAGMPLFGVMAAAVWRGETIAGVIFDPIRDDWAIAVKGEGAWIENSSGRLTDLHVAAPPPLSKMSGIVNWLFFPAPLKAKITANLSRVAAAVDYRCAAHQYRAVAAGHYDFALYGKPTPWDHAPGALIVQEAGGHTAFLDGQPYTVRRRSGGLLCACDRQSWHALREALVGDAA